MSKQVKFTAKINGKDQVFVYDKEVADMAWKFEEEQEKKYQREFVHPLAELKEKLKNQK